MKTLKAYFQKLYKNKPAFIAAVLVVVVGVATLFVTSAATGYFSFEAEGGSRLGSATNINDQSASGGQAIEFGTGTTGASGQFVRKVDVGPQSSTNGHTPAGTLTKWTGSNVINSANFPRGSDGWITIKGYEFTGPVKVTEGNIRLIDCKISAGNLTSGVSGTLFMSSTAPTGEITVDHCEIDQGPTGWSKVGMLIYQPMKATVRWSYFHGVGDGLNVDDFSLIHDNYIEVNGQGTQNNPGHIDGIAGTFWKNNWTARHNTILSSVVPTDTALASGAENGEENGGNIGIWGHCRGTPNYATECEGIVADNNYINGFNTGVSLAGSNSNNPNIIKNNYFGKNFRFYPSLRYRTWDDPSDGIDYLPYTLVEPNNVYDVQFDEATGNVTPY